MNKLWLIALAVLLTACAQATEKVFVANEEDSSVSVIDATTLKEIDRVPLEEDGIRFSPHNIQAHGDLVLITANAPHEEDEHAHGGTEDSHDNAAHDMDAMHDQMHDGAMETMHTQGILHTIAQCLALSCTMQTGIGLAAAHGEEHEEAMDQLIVMDAITHKITRRIPIEAGAHLAHVVAEGDIAFVTSTDKDLVYKVNLITEGITAIPLPKGTMPHGIRLNGNQAVIAAMDGHLILLDLNTKQITSVPLPGKGVQAGIAGDLVMVSVYDTKQLAIYDGSLQLIDLPDAFGPIQMYPSSDNRYVYVADQGVYFDQPAGNAVYKVDLETRSVVAAIETGYAPHGVVVSPDGRVWVTNLKGNSVSLIKDNVKVAEIPVGKAPNGITYWRP